MSYSSTHGGRRSGGRGLAVTSDLLPRSVRVECLHGLGHDRGSRAQVLLIHDAVVIDDKGHDPGHAVLRGKGHEGEPSHQATVGEVVIRSARRVLPLGGEDAVVVAPVRDGVRRVLGVALAPRPGDQWPQRTGGLPRVRRPVQAVALSRAAGERARVMQERIAVGITRVVLALGVDVGEGDLNRVELVLADAPVEDLLPARRGVEAPPRAIRNDGNREREVVAPHDQDHLAAAGLEPVLVTVLGHEALLDASVGHRVSRRDEPLSVLAENRQQCLLVPRPEGGDQGVRGLLE